MVRNYEKKGPKWTASELHDAAILVLGKIKSERKAAEDIGVSQTTIRAEIAKIQGRQTGDLAGSGKGKAIHPVLEAELADMIRVMCRSGFPPIQADIPEYVQAWITMDLANRAVPAFSKQDQKPGEEWVRNFMKRQKLSLKKTVPMEKKRKTANEDPFVIYDHYEKLEALIKEKQLEGRPDRIFNTDETCFCHDPSNVNVVGIRGEKTPRVRAGPGRSNTTVLATTCADGTCMDPMIVYQGKRMQVQWKGKTDECPKTSYGVSENGWMTTELFETWFTKVFVPYIQEKGDGPAVLLFDGHVSHLSLGTVTAARDAGGTLYKLPAKTTDADVA